MRARPGGFLYAMKGRFFLAGLSTNTLNIDGIYHESSPFFWNGIHRVFPPA
jgi:hypothetical protein